MSQTTESSPTDLVAHTSAADPAEYDALADLFLGDQGSPRRVRHEPASGSVADSPSHAGPRIDGLVLGHLPVMASAWVQQYARQLATDHGGPVALLRLRSGEASLELIGSRHADEPINHPTLDAAITEAGAHAVAWLIRVDETTEPRLPDLPVHSITLLTGANEAALVSSYRTLKNLVRPGDDADGPDLRIVIMGATPEQATDATAKLERAAAAFLGRPVRINSCVARIGGRLSAVLFRGPCPESVDALIPRLRSLRRPIAPSSLSTAAAPKRNGPETPAPTPAMRPIAPPNPAPIAPGTLAQHLPRLRALEIRCPTAPTVELALDDAGVLHLLAVGEPGCIAGLLAAAAWAKSHHPILRMALMGLAPGLAPGAEPMMHMFVDDARAARPLAETSVRLHLRARVDAAGAGWLCVPLN